jgi:hypothetical protein
VTTASSGAQNTDATRRAGKYEVIEVGQREPWWSSVCSERYESSGELWNTTPASVMESAGLRCRIVDRWLNAGWLELVC